MMKDYNYETIVVPENNLTENEIMGKLLALYMDEVTYNEETKEISAPMSFCAKIYDEMNKEK